MIFFMDGDIFSITEDYYNNKRKKKYCCKNPLSGTKHFCYFRAKLTFKTQFIMKRRIEAVQEFHTAFGLGMNEKPIADLGEAKNMLRFNLMKEENEEYLEAANNNDLTEVADALGDMLYILCGTIIEHGMQHKIEEVFEEIQRSNMSKLGENGKPIYREDGKVLKGPNYFKPEIQKILDK